MLLFIVGASYAYFSVGTTNNFGTHTISGTMEGVGSVSLVSTGNNISLNLSAADMMQEQYSKRYYGSTDGTPISTDNIDDAIIKLADATVTGPGTYDCDYTMQITATGTNNMYTAFQGMSGKSNYQIQLGIGDYYFFYDGPNGHLYDFNAAGLFPITYQGHFSEISSSNSVDIYGAFRIVNENNINQTALAGTDIQMTATVTSFTCTAVTPYLRSNSNGINTVKYYNNCYDSSGCINTAKYDSNQVLVNNNYYVYLKEITPSLEQTIANRHFYASVFNTGYSTIDDCLNSLSESLLTCIKVSNDYDVTTINNKPYKSIFDTEEECEDYIDDYGTGEMCIEYNKDDIYSELHDSISHEICISTGVNEICFKENDWQNASTYKTAIENMGGNCNFTDSYLYCSLNGNTCSMVAQGSVSCNGNGASCVIGGSAASANSCSNK